MMSIVRAKHARDPEWVPGWIGVNIWPRLLEHWATDLTFLKRSHIGKVNRASEKGGCLHSGGSASSYTTSQRMEKFDKKAKEVLSPFDGSSPTSTMRLLDHSTSQTIWKEIVGRGKSYKYYGAGSMASNLLNNRCIYERSIDGEGGSLELEQARTQSQKELQEMRTQLKQQQDFFILEIQRNRELVEEMERMAERRDRRHRECLPQQDSANNESLYSKDGDGDDDEDSENA
uniref:Transposase, Ptta/En/Spm, plant n=1 Tax=Medicago truncatula TaxID=3880 RepID=A2Q2H1_MEDTR|nr:hypothetical protein MtrDRAFT_AC150800g42v2 [Medicago truncatula]